MARKKHQPQRTCIVCRQVKNKRDLLRLVRTPAGQVVPDLTGKANGRGAYLCRSTVCQRKLNPGRLTHALNVNLSETELAALRNQMEQVVAPETDKGI